MAVYEANGNNCVPSAPITDVDFCLHQTVNLTAYSSYRTPIFLKHLLVHDGVKIKRNLPYCQQWLARNGLGVRKLLSSDFQNVIANKNSSSRETNSDTLLEVLRFEAELHSSIYMITNKIKWLMEGSRKVFGVNNIQRLGLLVDASDRFLLSNHIGHLRNCLRDFLNEQLIGTTEDIYLAIYGSETINLWSKPVKVSPQSLTEAKQFISKDLKPSGGANLLGGFKHMFRVASKHKLTGLTVVIGSVPDQDGEQLEEFIQQCLPLGEVGRFQLHLIIFDVANLSVSRMVTGLATCNRCVSLHCYTTSNDGSLFASDCIRRLLNELKLARQILELVTPKRVELEDIEKKATENISDTSAATGYLDRPIFFPSSQSRKLAFRPETSKGWLARHGLDAYGLNLFEVLSPNAYAQISEYVNSIKKFVHSQVLAKMMVQVKWPDNSVKNVHVDVAQLTEFQNRLANQIAVYEQRICWLNRGGRAVFGAIVERHVTILIDITSKVPESMEQSLVSLRNLIEDQIGLHVCTFNVIVIGERIEAFHHKPMKVSREILQEAWDWITRFKCGGTRNYLGAIKLAIEQIGPSLEPHGVYLLATGPADQMVYPIVEYLESTTFGLPLQLHVVFLAQKEYGITETHETCTRFVGAREAADSLRDLAHATGGRFQWAYECGLIESDDVLEVVAEIRKALDYSQQANQILSDYKARIGRSDPAISSSESLLSSQSEASNLRRTKSVTHSLAGRIALDILPSNKLTSSRRAFLLKKRAEMETLVPKTLAWRPPVYALEGGSQSRSRPGSVPAALKFYPEVVNNVGLALRGTTTASSLNRWLGKVEIPNREEMISSRKWLQKYSLKALGLNLTRLVAGPECRHGVGQLTHSKTEVNARYCIDLFPLIKVNGQLRHLHFTPQELNSFESQIKSAMHRYVKRLLWLLSSPNIHFGVFLESCVVIVIDISGSTNGLLPDLQEKLETIIWQQLCQRGLYFNLIAFNSEVNVWANEGPVLATETTCPSAIDWIRQLRGWGGSSILIGLSAALKQAQIWQKSSEPNSSTSYSESTVGIYLLTDGQPDKSCTYTLDHFFDVWWKFTGSLPNPPPSSAASIGNRRRRRQQPITDRLPRIHAILTGDVNVSAESLMETLARETGGRFYSMVEGQRPIQATLNSIARLNDTDTTPELLDVKFKSDDLTAVAEEIEKCRSIMMRIKEYRCLYGQLRK